MNSRFNLNLLRRFDAYPKPAEEISIKTYEGATVTIISALFIIVLVGSEIRDYLTPKIKSDLFVDTSRNPNLKIELDIIIPTISCDFLALDAMDSSGEQHLRIDHNIYKVRLDLEGQPIEEAKKEDITKYASKKKEEIASSTTEKITCGSCYGAALNESQCCNTCDDVKEAYRQRKWSLSNLNEIDQCKNEHYTEKLKNAFTEGCQIQGSLQVNRVGGSFHIAPGQSFSVSHVHVHDVQPFSSAAFNTSHYIQHLSFGKSLDDSFKNPLDGQKEIAVEGATMFQYYIKIIPVTYVQKNKSTSYSNHFSVTKHQKAVHLLSGESGMPGIFFSYELSPFMVKYTESVRPIGHLITTVCAIIGGVITVAGIIVRFLNISRESLQKIELGKAS